MRFSIPRSTKRGSLELSTNAIVVIVLAFVMLGLGLSIIRTLGNNTSDAIPKALGLADLDQKPTADAPLTIPDTLKIQAGGTPTNIKIGYYNADGSDHQGVNFIFRKCLDPSAANSAEIDQNLPTVTTLSQDVSASKAAAFNAIIKTPTANSGVAGGKTYICEFDVVDGTSTTVLSKQIALQVTS